MERMFDDDWVEVRSCAWPHEAAFFKSLLESEQIEVSIPNEHTLSIQPLYAPALGGVRVLVRRHDLARARAMLDSEDETGDRRESQ